MSSTASPPVDLADFMWQLGAVLFATVAFYVFLNSDAFHNAVYFIQYSTSFTGKYRQFVCKVDPAIAEMIPELPELSLEQKELMINVTSKHPWELWYSWYTWDKCKNYQVRALAAFLHVPSRNLSKIPGLCLKAHLHGGGEEWVLYNQKVLETPFLQHISHLSLTIKPEFLRMPKPANNKHQAQAEPADNEATESVTPAVSEIDAKDALSDKDVSDRESEFEKLVVPVAA